MKVAGKVLVAVVVLGLLLLLGYAVYRYVLPRWVPILFYAYSGLGSVVFIVGIVRVISQSGKSGSFREDVLKTLRTVAQKSDLPARIARLRDGVAVLARAVAGAIVWPVDTFFGTLMAVKNPGITPTEAGVRQNLRLSEHYYSLFALAVTLAVFGLEFRDVDLGKYGAVVLSLVLASTALRHVGYSVQTTPLPAILRRVSANPYLAFLVIIAADFSTLVLALTALSAPGKLSSVTLDDLRGTANQLLQAQEPLKLLRGMKLTEHQVIVGVVGLLFYLALFKTITELKEFKRRDEDYIWLAGAANMLGNFAAALRHLRKVESWNVEARSAEIVALIGVNEIDKAEQKARQLLEHSHKGISPEQIFGAMWQAYLIAPVPEDPLVTLYQHAVTSNVRDALVQDGMGVIEGNRHLQERALEVFAAAKDKYPLTIARLLALSGDRAAALEIVKQTNFPLLLDEVIASASQLTLTVSNPDTTPEADAQSFRDWAPTALPRIRELMKVAGQPWERVAAFAQAMGVLAIARHLAPDRVQELTFLCDTFKDESQVEDEVVGLKAVELRYQSLARTS